MKYFVFFLFLLNISSANEHTLSESDKIYPATVDAVIDLKIRAIKEETEALFHPLSVDPNYIASEIKVLEQLRVELKEKSKKVSKKQWTERVQGLINKRVSQKKTLLEIQNISKEISAIESKNASITYREKVDLETIQSLSSKLEMKTTELTLICSDIRRESVELEVLLQGQFLTYDEFKNKNFNRAFYIPAFLTNLVLVLYNQINNADSSTTTYSFLGFAASGIWLMLGETSENKLYSEKALFEENTATADAKKSQLGAQERARKILNKAFSQIFADIEKQQGTEITLAVLEDTSPFLKTLGCESKLRIASPEKRRFDEKDYPKTTHPDADAEAHTLELEDAISPVIKKPRITR